MDFQKLLQYKISWKFVWWELSCSMLMDGQTDKTKLGVNFCCCDFADMLKNEDLICTISEAWKLSQDVRMSIYQ
jgi:hypothetical protein